MRAVGITKTPEQALAALMRYCSRAERATGDCLRLMRGWGIGEREQAGIMKRLVESQFVDDERFAGTYVRDKVAFSGWGARKIAQGLRAKGMAREIVERAISEIDKEGSQERLAELLERKRRAIKLGTPYEIRGKLFRFAMGRGYDYDAVMEAISNLGISD